MLAKVPIVRRSDCDPTWVMPAVRKKFELFAAVRPSRSYPNINSIHKAVDKLMNGS